MNCSLVSSVCGATFSVSPNVISNTYNGYFTLQIGGLTNGETVAIENYMDVNGNGTLDLADMLMDAFKLVDGSRAIIGGATNVCAPGDVTGVDGNITAYVPYLSNRPQQGMGRHLLRLSSPTGNFSPLIVPLMITNSPLGQSISGKVTCSATNVPYAVVVVLSPSPNGKGDMVAEVVTDQNGAYTMSLPAGNFQVLAFRPGYVLSMATSPQVALASGATVTANLILVPATQMLSGRVVKSANTNSPVPGVFMVLQSGSGFVTVGSSDTNGYFTATVVPDGWQISIDSSSLAPIGFVGTQSPPRFDTTAGDVTNALVLLTKGTAMVYGTIRDGANAPLGGISFYGNNDTNTLESTGWSDPYGNYSVVTTAGNWWAGPDSWAFGANMLVGGTAPRTLLDGQAIRQDLVVVQASATISGTVTDTQGRPVAGVDIWCSTTQTGVNFSANSQTDAAGHYTLGAFNGSWNIGFGCEGANGLASMNYQCPSPVTVVIPPVNAMRDFILYPIGTPKLDPPFITHPGQLALTLYGQPGTNYLIQYTTNLADPASWQPLTNFVATNNVSTIWDNSSFSDTRFYRARIW